MKKSSPFTTNVLEEAIKNSNKRDYLRVMGDWNTRIGDDIIPGQKALEFVERHKLVIADTISKYKRSRMVTWHASNGQSYKIDFIMVSNKLKSCTKIKGTRTFPRADVHYCGSDHDLVMTTIIVKLLKNARKE